MSIVVGIDASLTGTAVCILSSDFTHEVQRFSSESSGRDVKARFERYWKLVHDVNTFLEGQQIEAIFLEGYSFGSKGRAITDLAEYGGLLRNMLIADFMAPVEVAPTSVKKWATGKGNADKMAVALAIQKRYNVSFASSDEFDAYALARMAACHVGWVAAENDAQRDALKKVAA